MTPGPERLVGPTWRSRRRDGAGAKGVSPPRGQGEGAASRAREVAALKKKIGAAARHPVGRRQVSPWPAQVGKSQRTVQETGASREGQQGQRCSAASKNELTSRERGSSARTEEVLRQPRNATTRRSGPRRGINLCRSRTGAGGAVAWPGHVAHGGGWWSVRCHRDRHPAFGRKRWVGMGPHPLTNTGSLKTRADLRSAAVLAAHASLSYPGYAS